jgi:integrase
MANRKASLVRVCKTERGWRYYPVAYSNNGRVKHGVVIVNGKEHFYIQGYYKVRFYSGDDPQYEHISAEPSRRDDPGLALDAVKVKRNRLDAAIRNARLGIQVVPEAESDNNTIRAHFAAYAKSKSSLSESLQSDVRRGAGLFVKMAEKKGRLYPAELTTQDIQDWVDDIQKRQGLSDRTRANLYATVKAFLILCGVADKIVSPEKNREWRKFTETEPEAFSEEDLNEFFAACHDDERLAYRLLLGTGFRRNEFRFLPWEHVSLTRRIAKVAEVKKVIDGKLYHFKPKDHEERKVPLEQALVEDLKKWKEAHPHSTWVFGTRNNRPYGKNKWLEQLKRIVRRAGLECGECDHCVLPDAERGVKARHKGLDGKWRKSYYMGCERWWLHKFRATYCTMWLRRKKNIKDVQKLMGHKDLASTMRYLVALTADDLVEHVDDVFEGLRNKRSKPPKAQKQGEAK